MSIKSPLAKTETCFCCFLGFLWPSDLHMPPLSLPVVTFGCMKNNSHRGSTVRSGAVIDLHFRSRYAKHLSTSVKPSGSEWKSLDEAVMQWNQFVVIELLVMIRFLFFFCCCCCCCCCCWWWWWWWWWWWSLLGALSLRLLAPLQPDVHILWHTHTLPSSVG